VRLSWAAVVCAASMASAAHACSCLEPSIAVAKVESDAVFTGKAVAVRRVTLEKADSLQQQPLVRDYVEVRMRVDRAWKGVRAGTVARVRTAFYGSECGFPFSRGQEYLVYARRSGKSDNQSLVTSICSRTKWLSQAMGEIDTLGVPASRRSWLRALSPS
jgi:hypothetical protein